MTMFRNEYENASCLREWAPLTDLLTKLPLRSNLSLFGQDVNLTCIDALPEFLALGTNVGIVYWYDRGKKELQRLKCENANVPITAVKLVSSVDYMVACGNQSGNISIFQVPKPVPDNVPDTLKPKNKQIERYTVSSMHKVPITALEWSKNGMKLFSGDKNGCVVLTEIDFYMHICKSSEILSEAYEVVQLSYMQQRLLISTIYRTIVCEKSDKWHVRQVGKKDRKVLGNFGGIIIQNSHKMNDALIYCTRPGLRLWISNLEGNVQKTLLFKDLLSQNCSEVPIINPISKNLRYVRTEVEPTFGILHLFSDNLFVTYGGGIVYILDPNYMAVIAKISNLRGILSLAVCREELFILEEEHNVIRISKTPENFNQTDGNTSMFTSLRREQIVDKSIKSIEVEEDVAAAEEATETLPVSKAFDDIGKQDFNDKILYKKTKSRKAKDKNSDFNRRSSSEEENLLYTKPTIMNLSTLGVLPDLRSPESINSDIEYKEKLLADILSINTIKLEETQLEPSSDTLSVCRDEIDEKPIIYSEDSTLQTKPELANIPDNWRLADLQINLEDSSNFEDPDTSLTDWEII